MSASLVGSEMCIRDRLRGRSGAPVLRRSPSPCSPAACFGRRRRRGAPRYAARSSDAQFAGG
eukprot:15317765-Alexandrium_andersonii.AAC.1